MVINAQKTLFSVGVGALDLGAEWLDNQGWSLPFATAQETYRLAAALASFGAQAFAPKYAGNWAEPVGLAVLPLVMHTIKDRIRGSGTPAPRTPAAREVGGWVPTNRPTPQGGYRPS